MKYPTLAEVDGASRYQLARWSRHLPSPGMTALDADEGTFQKTLDAEVAVMNHILAKFGEAGGWDPALSKMVGW